MDTIANMLTSLRNAGAIGKETIDVPFSKLTLSILEVLKGEGYVKAVHPKPEEFYIEVVLDYDNTKSSKIREVKRISRPGRRVYYQLRDIKKVKNGFGHIILSTPQGIMTGKAARANNTGGEALFEIF